METCFKKLLQGDYQVNYRWWGKALFFRDNKVFKEFLFLNEIFCGSNDHASSYWYDFINYTEKEEFKYMRSTGVIIYTGTGSTAWVKSMNQISSKSIKFLVEKIS